MGTVKGSPYVAPAQSAERKFTLKEFCQSPEFKEAFNSSYPSHGSIYGHLQDHCEKVWDGFSTPMTIDEMKKLARKNRYTIVGEIYPYPISFLIEMYQRKRDPDCGDCPILTPWSFTGLGGIVQCQWRRKEIEVNFYEALAISDFENNWGSNSFGSYGEEFTNELQESYPVKEADIKVTLANGEERYFEDWEPLQNYVDYFRHACIKNSMNFEDYLSATFKGKNLTFDYED